MLQDHVKHLHRKKINRATNTVEPKRIVAKRWSELLCITGNSDELFDENADWLKEEEVDVVGFDIPNKFEPEGSCVIESLDDWHRLYDLIEPWT